MLAATSEKRGFRSSLAACGGGHIHVPECVTLGGVAC